MGLKLEDALDVPLFPPIVGMAGACGCGRLETLSRSSPNEVSERLPVNEEVEGDEGIPLTFSVKARMVPPRWLSVVERRIVLDFATEATVGLGGGGRSPKEPLMEPKLSTEPRLLCKGDSTLGVPNLPAAETFPRTDFLLPPKSSSVLLAKDALGTIEEYLGPLLFSSSGSHPTMSNLSKSHEKLGCPLKGASKS